MKHDRFENWAARCLARVVPDAYREQLLGDLHEERALRSRLRGGAPNSTAWYWSQLLFSTPPLLWMAITRSVWIGAFGVAAVAYLTGATLESLVDSSVARLFAPGPHYLTSVLLVLGTVATVALASERIRPKTSIVLAAILSVDFLLRLLDSSTAPTWYNATIFVLGPLVALLSGTLLSDRQRKLSVKL